jgi:GTPase SAR1 family protein
MDGIRKEKEKKPFNVVLLGNIESEKAALLHKFIKKRFAIQQLKEMAISEENGEEDPHIDEVMNSVEIHGETVRMKIWDNVSANKLFSTSNKSLKAAQGIILFYSVSNRKSFNMLKLSLSKIIDFDKYDIPMVMVGNDSETQNREVSYEEAKALADSYGLRFYETSIRSGMGGVFEDIGEQVFYREYGDDNSYYYNNKSNSNNTKGMSTSKSTKNMNQKLSLYSNDDFYQNSFNNRLIERKGKNISIFSLSRGKDKNNKNYNKNNESGPEIDPDESNNSSRNNNYLKTKNKNNLLVKSPDAFINTSMLNNS